MIILLNHLVNFLLSRFKKLNYKCKSCVGNNQAKNMFSLFLKPILAFFMFLLVNQNIHAQLCTHVKNHH